MENQIKKNQTDMALQIREQLEQKVIQNKLRAQANQLHAMMELKKLRILKEQNEMKAIEQNHFDTFMHLK